VILELEPLNPGLRQALAPVPRLELAQRHPTEDDLVTQEREERA